MGGLRQNPNRPPIGRFNDTIYGSFWKILAYDGYNPLSLAELIADGYDMEGMQTPAVSTGNNARHWAVFNDGSSGTYDNRTNGKTWNRPTIEAELSRPGKIVTTMSHKRLEYGGRNIEIKLANITPYQARYYQTELFDDGLSMFGAISIFDRGANEIKAFQGMLWYPDVNEAELGMGGFSVLPLKMVSARELPLGPLLTPYPTGNSELSFSLLDNISNTTTRRLRHYWDSNQYKRYYNLNLTASVNSATTIIGTVNIGDENTYDDPAINYDNPIEIAFYTNDVNFTLATISNPTPSPSIAGTFYYSPAGSYGASWLAGSPTGSPISGIKIIGNTHLQVLETLAMQLTMSIATTGTYSGYIEHDSYYTAQPLDKKIPVIITVS